MTHPAHLAFLALDLADERIREVEARRRFLHGFEPLPETPGTVRRLAARAAAALSRGSADVARRLDAGSMA